MPHAELKRHCDQSDAEALLEMGNRFYRGEGVAKDVQQALAWWRKAEKNGNHDATLQIAFLYLQKIDTSKSPNETIDYLVNASKNGCKKCSYLAAQTLLAGELVPKDEGYGLRLLFSSANDNNAEAQFEIGWRIEKGLGLPQNDLLAEDFYFRALANGSNRAAFNLAMLLVRQAWKDKIDQGLNLLGMLAAQGDAEAQFNLGQILLEGKITERNERKAYEWFSKGAEQGEPLSNLAVAILKIKGEVVPKDLVGAYIFASRASISLSQAAEIKSLIEKALSPTELTDALRQLKQMGVR